MSDATTATTPDGTRYRFVGVTDETVECQKCGKTQLRRTVVLAILDADGNDEAIAYYGSMCAARALGYTGRGASRRILDQALAAHRQLLENAYDARFMLARYGLPEIGAPSVAQLQNAAFQYSQVHRHATWAGTQKPAGWEAMTRDMLRRKQAALADVARLSLTVPTTDTELNRMLARL